MKSEKKAFKKLKRLKSLNVTLWRNFCLFALLIILLISVICYLIVQSSFSSFMYDKINSVGNAVSQRLDEAAASVNPFDEYLVEEYIERQSFENNMNIAVLTGDGRVVIPNSDRITDSEREYWDGVSETVRDRLSSAGGSFIIYENDNVYTYAAATSFGADPYSSNYLVVRYSLDVANNTMNAIQVYMIVVGVFIILLAFLVAYSMAQNISDPLKSLTATANKMAKGDYNVNFASAEYQEIAQLSDALNYACAEIKKTDGFQKELLANVSHDLRTPLTMIKAYASMIKEISGDNPEKRNQHLQVIIDEADRLTGLVNDVLNMSKISSDINQINKKVFNLTDFLYGIMKKFEYLRDMQGYNFMIDIDPDLYTCADEEKIGQVLYNLISNAVNYTGEDKKVFVSLKHDEASGRIKFKVRDTGKGISKEDLPAIWNRYYRVKENHARPVKGTGLGLSIVKTILEKHSFDFGADSELGKGSEFWVDFPEVPPELPEEAANEDKQVAAEVKDGKDIRDRKKK